MRISPPEWCSPDEPTSRKSVLLGRAFAIVPVSPESTLGSVSHLGLWRLLVVPGGSLYWRLCAAVLGDMGGCGVVGCVCLLLRLNPEIPMHSCLGSSRRQGVMVRVAVAVAAMVVAVVVVVVVVVSRV